jgi:hypothetical protein
VEWAEVYLEQMMSLNYSAVQKPSERLGFPQLVFSALQFAVSST